MPTPGRAEGMGTIQPMSFVPLCALLVALPWLWPFTSGPVAATLPYLAGVTVAAVLLLAWPARASGRDAPLRAVAAGWLGAALVSGGIALLQYFDLEGPLFPWVNIAEPGQAFGNLRQPNHFSTLLVFASAGFAWLGARQRLRPALAALGVALCIAGIVWTASRTGMVAMVFLSAWGLLDRRLPRVLRLTLAAAPLVYAAWWGGMWWLSHADRTVAFAGEARLHDGSDISSSRFKIWANVLSLIQQHPWWGVGYGEFTAALKPVFLKAAVAEADAADVDAAVLETARGGVLRGEEVVVGVAVLTNPEDPPPTRQRLHADPGGHHEGHHAPLPRRRTVRLTVA